MEWNAGLDSFRPTTSSFSSEGAVTKCALASDIARIFDIMGWCSPCIIRPKILLQRLWEHGLSWDDPVPTEIFHSWEKWHSELPTLKKLTIPRCYFPAGITARTLQLHVHGFSDTSEVAYTGVVHLRITGCNDSVSNFIGNSKDQGGLQSNVQYYHATSRALWWSWWPGYYIMWPRYSKFQVRTSMLGLGPTAW